MMWLAGIPLVGLEMASRIGVARVFHGLWQVLHSSIRCNGVGAHGGQRGVVGTFAGGFDVEEDLGLGVVSLGGRPAQGRWWGR